MLNKLALGGLLLTSSLALTSAVTAGFEDDGNTLKVSVRKLKRGSKDGEIFVQGTKCAVSNLTPALWDSLQDLKKDDKLKAFKNQGSFYFSYTRGGFESRYNEETKQWETDFEKPLPDVTVFNLKVTPLSDKTTVETIEANNNVVPLTTTLSSLKLEQKEELKEEKPSVSSSVTISPVEQVEFDDSGQSLVLTAAQLEKGLKEGKLVTNHGTFSVAPADQNAPNSFVKILDKQQKFTGYVSEGQFYFHHSEYGFAMNIKYNDETQTYGYQPDYTKPGEGGFEMRITYNEETQTYDYQPDYTKPKRCYFKMKITYNEETQTYDYQPDYTKPEPVVEIFNLVVKKMDN